MKKILVTVLLFFAMIAPFNIVEAATWVNGYYRSNGTYVQGHYRSSPDGNPYNNWSYPGNVNPYTGKVAPGNTSTYLKNYSQSTGLYKPVTSSEYTRLKSNYESSCGYTGYGGQQSVGCAKAVSDYLGTYSTSGSGYSYDYDDDTEVIKTKKIGRLTKNYADAGDCDSKFLSKQDKRTCRNYLETKYDWDVEWKVVKNNKSQYKDCGGTTYSIHLLDKTEQLLCKKGVPEVVKR